MKTRCKTLIISSLLLIAAFVKSTLAQEVPDVLFRADRRDPSIIFASGFQSWGDDEDIIRHVSGYSVGVFPSSNYVATTTSAEIAAKFLSWDQSYQTFWVYTIRPNNSFYSANLSLREIVNTSNDENVIAEARSLISSQNEWLALRQIPPSQIISATEYRNNTQQPKPTGRVLTNDRFNPDNTTANATPYVAHGRATTTDHVYGKWDR
ncbi:hypothetical protein ACFSE0_11160 [Ochrobactrum teleogrylli]|uniref:Pierisin-like domain-containing protein n=1 Tax=Ochrobactrum teleogrylli TaxID=2479765 RepID=A0ABY2XZ95_9HYPH|nr:hypothetical protein [[Ochrobactrum] teleogrylli]TNV09312.1 hypothetical protein FIC94_22115 [[Ochrobactrum] teleogrylli]